jgi:tetratricopeptide (TPR) repeat protein
MAEPKANELVVCPACGQETPHYEDCVLCGHSLEDSTASPRELAEDELQTMMMDAKVQEIKAKREILFGDAWDHAPWIERLQELAEQAPDHPKVHYYIGAAQIEMGQYRQAIVSMTRALESDPRMVDAYRRRGDCHYTLVPVLGGDVQIYYDRALADYEMALWIAPDVYTYNVHGSIIGALWIAPDVYTYNVHGSIIGALGRWEEAIEEYDLAAELSSDYSETFFNRGYAYKVLGQTKQAVADFERFLAFERHWNQELVAQAQAHIKELLQPD